MKNMQELDLSRNKLVGPFPLCLTSLSELRVLDLSSNQMTGNVPSALGNLQSLKYLSLVDNNFDNLSKLRVLILGSKSKSFQVESKSFWKPKFRLSHIALPSCNLEKVPHFLQYQKDLSHIDLSDNKISEIFPHWLLNIGWVLPHLEYMKLANNGFQGNLPSSMGNMKSISYLDISHNSFNGELPRSFVMGCYSIYSLTLSHNKLSGEVFQESANFTVIWDLSMENNMFTGKIGERLPDMKSLKRLDISNNNLMGVIPRWIGELPDLRELHVSNNSLESEIPISLFTIL
ncbi:hypothetical protein YC2023_078938 [Brassica napus]